MTLRPILASLFCVCRGFVFIAMATIVTTMASASTVATMTSMSKQMHPDERPEYQYPHPVLHQPVHIHLLYEICLTACIVIPKTGQSQFLESHSIVGSSQFDFIKKAIQSLFTPCRTA